MSDNQTYSWEHACTKTRRNLWWRKRRLKMFQFRSGERVLEVGCGDGLNVKVLRAMGVDAVGVDISEKLLREGEEVGMVLGLAQQFPFTTGAFDAVLLDAVYYHLADDPRNLNEIHRVLQKGGRLCLVEMHGSWVRKAFNRITLAGFPLLRGRKLAYLAEQSAMERWLRHEDQYVRFIEQKFKRMWFRYDWLSIVAMYEAIC